MAGSGGGFVDLELWVAEHVTRPGVRLWFEVKHGAPLHGDQLLVYSRDIKLETGSGLVVVIAPRQSPPEGIPDGTPIINWQQIAEIARNHAAFADNGVERFLLGQ